MLNIKTFDSINQNEKKQKTKTDNQVIWLIQKRYSDQSVRFMPTKNMLQVCNV